jgi:hypothetical protein
MATRSILHMRGTSSFAASLTDKVEHLRHEIALLRDRLPPEESTSVEIVWLCQQLHRMPVQPPRVSRLDRRGRQKLG